MADRWLLIEAKDGTVEVQRNSRAHSGGHRDLTAAQKAIRDEVGLRDRVVHVAPDGYRQNIGRSTRPRKGWRR